MANLRASRHCPALCWVLHGVLLVAGSLQQPTNAGDHLGRVMRQDEAFVGD
jgi:hypothetical protein